MSPVSKVAECSTAGYRRAGPRLTFGLRCGESAARASSGCGRSWRLPAMALKRAASSPWGSVLNAAGPGTLRRGCRPWLAFYRGSMTSRIGRFRKKSWNGWASDPQSASESFREADSDAVYFAATLPHRKCRKSLLEIILRQPPRESSQRRAKRDLRMAQVFSGIHLANYEWCGSWTCLAVHY